MNTKITTSFEDSEKSKTSLGGNLISLIPSVNLAVWSMVFSFKEEARRHIEHVSIKIKMANDGLVPISVVIKVKIKGSNNLYSFEREASMPFDIKYDDGYKKLHNQIEQETKNMVTGLFQDVINGHGVATKEMNGLL